MTIPRHPAKFSDAVLEAIERHLPREGALLDPFAGTGRVHELRREPEGPLDAGRDTLGVELEPEWAEMHQRTVVGDARHLPDNWTGVFDCVVTSPAYGNRMADHHEASDFSRRNTYRHALGRPLTPGNSGAMQWGDAYRELHQDAWEEVRRVLKAGAPFILNISDHIRAGKRQRVTAWHVETILRVGFDLVSADAIETPRNRYGANGDLRCEYESVILFEKGK